MSKLREWLIERLSGGEKRSEFSTTLAYPDAWLFEAMGAMPSSSGERINEHTCLQISAVYACVRVISEAIGSLPLHVYRRLDPRGREKAVEAREYKLLHDAPNPRMSACVFRESVTAQVLLFGNGYALIDYDGAGKTRALWPIAPGLVTVEMAPDGGLRYRVRDAVTKDETVYPGDLIIHIPGLSFDGVSGMSPVRLHKEGMGLSAALEKFGAEYFGYGTALSGVLQAKTKLSKEAQDRLKVSWSNKYSGKGNRHAVAVLEEGLEFKEVFIQANNAQFVESRKFQLAEMGRIFRVPAHMIGDLEKSSFSNIEHQSLEFVEHTLRPWLVRWEQELNRKLFPEGSKYVEHNIDGLLRGDFNTRMAGYGLGRQWGFLSVNDIREKEGMNPLPGKDGDQYLVPSNMTTPELLEKPKVAPAPAAAKPGAAIEEDEIKRHLRPLFADAIRRSLNYECKDPVKLRGFVSRAFTPVLCAMASIAGRDQEAALAYAEQIPARVADWGVELVKRETLPAPMEGILERELESAFRFLARESAA